MPQAVTEYQTMFTPKRLQHIRQTFMGVGVDNYTQPPSQNPDQFMQLTNVMPISTGILQRRWGYGAWSLTNSLQANRGYQFQSESSGVRRIVWLAADGTGSLSATNGINSYNESGVYQGAVFTPAAGASVPRLCVSRDYAYFTDGVLTDLNKWDGTTVTNWGIAPASSALTVGAPGAGSVSLNFGRNYFVVFYNRNTGGISDLNPVSASTGPVSSAEFPLSAIPTSPDSQVTDRILLATADGGDETTLYFLTDITDNVTTTYTDNTPNLTLLNNNVYQETDQFGNLIGVADNSTPPNASLPTLNQGRMYMVSGSTLFFSKTLSDLITGTDTVTGRWEEAWPAENALGIALTAEHVTAMLSDGTALYIATERRIRRLLGSGPSTFTEPQVVYNEAGVLNQDVWQVVFLEEQPVGTMWLTPDFRVIGSDFNTYQDVGTPIQTTLNAINTAAAQTCWAMFVSSGPYDLYILGVPTGAATKPNTLCVYDMRAKQWCVWQLVDSPLCGVFNINVNGVPQWLINAATGAFYIFGSNYVQDRVGNTPANFTVTAQTSWFSAFDMSVRKFLNELEVDTPDGSTLVTVEAANTGADFASPIGLATSAALSTSPFGGYMIPLIGTPSGARYHRLTFSSNTQLPTLLNGYRLDVVPWARLS